MNSRNRLIRADLGVPMTLRIIKDAAGRAKPTHVITAMISAEVAREEIGRILPTHIRCRFDPLPAKPKVILIVGVNGTGKTTSTAKLAHFFKNKPPYCAARSRRYFSRGGDRAARHLGRTARR